VTDKVQTHVKLIHLQQELVSPKLVRVKNNPTADIQAVSNRKKQEMAKSKAQSSS
jgi:hypothetical protein